VNIVVCVKQVPDTSIPIELNHQTNSLKIDDLVFVINPCDRLAVEEALRVKERCGSGQVIVVSMGMPSVERILRKCLAVGADEAILLCDSAFDDSDSYATAVVLAKAISSLQYDLVLCGARSLDNNAGLVGPAIAEMLGIPLVSEVTKIEYVDREEVKVHKRLEKGDKAIVGASIPVLLTMEAGVSESRYASLPSLIAAQRKDIEQFDLAALGLSFGVVGSRASKTNVLAVELARPRAKKLFSPDSSLPAAERMRLVMSGGMTSKSSELLEGQPDDIALRLVQFLQQHKVVPSSASGAD
jgi:electron transfer flavoprotein beta subunit